LSLLPVVVSGRGGVGLGTGNNVSGLRGHA
jgi:hypothetical protein